MMKRFLVFMVMLVGLGVAADALAQSKNLTVAASHSNKSMTTGPFRDTTALEASWSRGVTTPDEVKQLVGEPNGSGNLVGVFDDTPYELWFYDDLETIGTKGSGGGVINLQTRQQFLMVFFSDGLYQGHMWFSNDSQATGWVH